MFSYLKRLPCSSLDHCWRPKHPSAIGSYVKYNKYHSNYVRRGVRTVLSWLTATIATTRAAFLRCSGRKAPCAGQLASLLHEYVSLYRADEILWPAGHSLNPNPWPPHTFINVGGTTSCSRFSKRLPGLIAAFYREIEGGRLPGLLKWGTPRIEFDFVNREYSI